MPDPQNPTIPLIFPDGSTRQVTPEWAQAFQQATQAAQAAKATLPDPKTFDPATYKAVTPVAQTPGERVIAQEQAKGSPSWLQGMTDATFGGPSPKPTGPVKSTEPMWAGVAGGLAGEYLAPWLLGPEVGIPADVLALAGTALGAGAGARDAGMGGPQTAEEMLAQTVGAGMGIPLRDALAPLFTRAGSKLYGRALSPSDNVLDDVRVPGNSAATPEEKRAFLIQQNLANKTGTPGAGGTAEANVAKMKQLGLDRAQTSADAERFVGHPITVDVSSMAPAAEASTLGRINATAGHYVPAQKAVRKMTSDMTENPFYSNEGEEGEPVATLSALRDQWDKPIVTFEPGPRGPRTLKTDLSITDLAEGLKDTADAANYNPALVDAGENAARKGWTDVMRKELSSSVDGNLPQGQRPVSDINQELQWRIPTQQALNDARARTLSRGIFGGPETLAALATAGLASATSHPAWIPYGAAAFVARPTNLGRIGRALYFVGKDGKPILSSVSKTGTQLAQQLATQGSNGGGDQ